jgi:hypothetical protein
MRKKHAMVAALLVLVLGVAGCTQNNRQDFCKNHPNRPQCRQ